MSELLEQKDRVRKAHHPEQTKVNLVNRLRRIEGQIRGIARMVESDVYCDDILNQITSVDAALSGGARYIVSGDKDLQALDTYQRVKVLSPREFVELMGL